MLSFIVPLALAFLAVRIVTGKLAGAEERGYLDIVFTTPLTRRRLVVGTVVAAAIVVAVVLALITAATWVAGTIVGPTRRWSCNRAPTQDGRRSAR